MRDFKIKLVCPPLSPLSRITLFGNMLPNFFLPYGLGVLAAYLRDNNYKVVVEDLWTIIHSIREHDYSHDRRINLNILRETDRIIDYVRGDFHDKKIEQFIDRLIQVVSWEDYALIGISVLSYAHFSAAFLLGKKLKSVTTAKIVFGGPFITLYGKKIFTQLQQALDYMIIGDGQIPLIRLIEHLEGQVSIEDVPNLLYKWKGMIKENSRIFFPIEDLCIPDFSDLSLDMYKLKIEKDIRLRLLLLYQMTRGCTHNCSFCNDRSIDSHLEYKMYNKVIQELKIMKERYQSDFFMFSDAAINCSYEYLDKLVDMFMVENLNIFWMANARADNLERKILHKMRKSGCIRLFFGIETGSNKLLKSMGKGFDIEKAASVLRDSAIEGIKNTIYLTVGYPHEKKEDIIETIEFIKKNTKYIDVIFVILPISIHYGSPLYSNPEKFGIENLRPTQLECLNIAFDEIGGLKWKKKVKQQQYHRKMLFRANFKYIISKKYNIIFIPFWFYSWFIEIFLLNYGNRFYRLFEHFLAYLIRKLKKK